MRVVLWDNPVVTKEFRGRMRGARAYWLLFAYLALLSLTLFFAYLSWWNSHASDMNDGGGGASFEIGRTFFLTLFYAQALLVTLITPALTAGAISLEREQRTFEMLRATTLPPRAIALGKLTSSVSFVVLLLTSSLPLVSLCFLLGGVSPGEVFFGYLLLVADALLFGAIGLAWSAHAANTAAATALSYGSIFLWFALTFPFSAAMALSGGRNVTPFEAVNPLGAVGGAVPAERYYGWTLPGWVPALLLVLSLAGLLLLSCVNRLEDDPKERAWPQRAAALVFCGLLVFFANGATLAPGSMLQMPFFMSLVFIGSLAVVAAMLFVPPFVTGDAVRGAARRVWTGYLAAGLPFALLLTILIGGILLFGIHEASHVTTAMPVSQLPAGGALRAQSGIGFWWRAVALLGAFTVCLGGLGLLLSAVLKNRWGALVGLYVLVALGAALPFFSYAVLQGREAAAAARRPAVNTLYLCPLLGLTQLAYDFAPPVNSGFGSYNSTFGGSFPAARGMAGYGEAPLWIGSSLVYLVLGGATYAAGWALLTRKRPKPLKTA